MIIHWHGWGRKRVVQAVLLALVLAQTAGYRACLAAQAPPPPAVEDPDGEAVQPGDLYRFTPLERLTPLPSGPGLLVFDPVLPADADQELKDLTAACGTWLYIAVGGQPAFGKTPGWSVPKRLVRRAEFKSVRLTAPQAARIAREAGCTHTAVGAVTRVGAGNRLTFTYQLWDVLPSPANAAPAKPAAKAPAKPAGKAAPVPPKAPAVAAAPAERPVGRPVTVSGTLAEIAAGLPRVARELVLAAGGAPTGISETLKLEPADLQLLGKAERSAKRGLNAEELKRLEELQELDPLACAIWLNTRWLRARRPMSPVVKKMVEAAPENAVIWWITGFSGVGNYRPYVETVKKLAERFPNNYLFAQAESWSLGEADRSVQAPPLERAVRCAPGNADGWLLLAQSISGVANELRRARYASKVPEADWPKLERYYGLWLQVALRATQLEPRNASAWLQVAVAATFGGHDEQAREAFWKSHALAPDRDELYSWGLQMFHAKWGGTPEEFEKISKLAVEATYLTAGDMVNISRALRRAEFGPRADALLVRAAQAARAEVELDSEDADAHYTLARIAADSRKLSDAVTELQATVRIHPDRADLHYEMAMTLYAQRSYTQAGREFSTVVRMAPGHGAGYQGLAMVLLHQGHLAEAEGAARKAVEHQPKSGYYKYWLGEIVLQRGRKDEALTHFEAAARNSESRFALNRRLCELLTQKGRLDEAIAAGRRAVEKDPKSVNAQTLLLRALLKKGEPEPAIEAARAAVEGSPKLSGYRLLLGNALILGGQKEEALAEWRLVLRLEGGKNTPEVREAQKQIEKHQ